MHFARLISTTVLALLLVVQSAFAQHGLSVDEAKLLNLLEVFGVFCVGWGVGVTSWLVTGHQAVTCLFLDMPRAWKLWMKNVLTSSLPVYKYLIAGGLLLMLGIVLVHQLWGVWTQAFNLGMVVGILVGTGHSFVNLRAGSPVDFFEANRRYLNEKRVPLFTDYEGP
jgi:hypothetical protein